MSWWAHLRLRTKIFLPFAALVLAVLLTTLWLVDAALRAQAERSLRQQLVVAGEVFRERVGDRLQRLGASTSLLAADFALKRAIATQDPDTLESVAYNYRTRMGLDLLWITDAEGRLLAVSGVDAEPNTPLADRSPVAEAVAAGASTAAIAAIAGRLFELVATPVVAPEPIAYLLAGNAIDDRTAVALESATGPQVSFLAADQLFATSWQAPRREELFPGDRVPPRVRPTVGRPFLLGVGGERWLSVLVPVEARLPAPLLALVQQSYDRALEPLAALRRRMALIGALALAAALAVGAAIAAGIAAPIRSLVTATRRILAGDFANRLGLRREDEIGALGRAFDEMTAGLQERERVKDTFGRFVSREIAEHVLGDSTALDGERRPVTILFQDVRGFTTLAEHTEPTILVGVVNQLFTAMVAAVEQEGGTVRQFTGDGVMALFGAPLRHDDDPARAVRAALGMLARLPGLNERLQSDGLPALRIGVGIHTGDVVTGCVGPDSRREYGIVGDAVNTASRIEGLTKEMGATILVSAATAAHLDSSFRTGRRAVLPVRGKEEPVEVVEVLPA
jgi:adenylate cyclase